MVVGRIRRYRRFSMLHFLEVFLKILAISSLHHHHVVSAFVDIGTGEGMIDGDLPGLRDKELEAFLGLGPLAVRLHMNGHGVYPALGERLELDTGGKLGFKRAVLRFQMRFKGIVPETGRATCKTGSPAGGIWNALSDCSLFGMHGPLLVLSRYINRRAEIDECLMAGVDAPECWNAACPLQTPIILEIGVVQKGGGGGMGTGTPNASKNVTFLAKKCVNLSQVAHGHWTFVRRSQKEDEEKEKAKAGKNNNDGEEKEEEEERTPGVSYIDWFPTLGFMSWFSDNDVGRHYILPMIQRVDECPLLPEGRVLATFGRSPEHPDEELERKENVMKLKTEL